MLNCSLNKYLVSKLGRKYKKIQSIESFKENDEILSGNQEKVMEF